MTPFLSTRGRYAVRILLFLAASKTENPATKQEIGKGEDISPDYVEQIMLRLRSAGLVRSHRGRCGGFTLARAADSITLAEVLTAVEGPIAPAPCSERGCGRYERCPARPVWDKAADLLWALFRKTTIGQMRKEAASLAAKGNSTYQI